MDVWTGNGIVYYSRRQNCERSSVINSKCSGLFQVVQNPGRLIVLPILDQPIISTSPACSLEALFWVENRKDSPFVSLSLSLSLSFSLALSQSCVHKTIYSQNPSQSLSDRGDSKWMGTNPHKRHLLDLVSNYQTTSNIQNKTHTHTVIQHKINMRSIFLRYHWYTLW